MNHKITQKKSSLHLGDFLWDLWCIVSVVGIWPRFIEPNLLAIKKLILKVPDLPLDLEGLKIVQFSDLHISPNIPSFYLDKVASAVKGLNPDLICFTGDFLCYSHLDDPDRLKTFLQKFHAPYGCYAILGNHDYAESISINEKGEYDILTDQQSMISKGIKRLFTMTKIAKKITPRVNAVGFHQELISILKNSPFQLLDNATKVITIKNSRLNLCGLGEYTLGRCQPEKAFKAWDKRYPGIILAHNPDSIPLLREYPGNIILCGHTHGGQVNLPWMWKKFTLLENMEFKYGLKKTGNKSAYINRGIGSVMHFRWFAMPEIFVLTLEKGNE